MESIYNGANVNIAVFIMDARCNDDHGHDEIYISAPLRRGKGAHSAFFLQLQPQHPPVLLRWLLHLGSHSDGWLISASQTTPPQSLAIPLSRPHSPLSAQRILLRCFQLGACCPVVSLQFPSHPWHFSLALSRAGSFFRLVFAALHTFFWFCVLT